MKKPIVIIGIGELGSVFASAFLRAGHPVYPITRGMNPTTEAERIADPELVLIAVGEEGLHPVLKSIPGNWRPRLGLLQNELLPQDWLTHSLLNPTIISVWFDKKKGRALKAVLPSAVFGPAAPLIHESLASVGITCHELNDGNELLYTLVLKNLYILTVNIAGLETGGTVGELWGKNRPLARELANEIIDVQQFLTAARLPRERLIQGLIEAFELDPHHTCTGRSASARLRRTLQHARRAQLAVPALLRIHAKQSRNGS